MIENHFIQKLDDQTERLKHGPIKYDDGNSKLAMAETTLVLNRRLASKKRIAWAKEMNEKRGDRRPKNRPEVYAEQVTWFVEHPQEELILQVVQIGDLAITALPNEVYGITGLKLKAVIDQIREQVQNIE